MHPKMYTTAMYEKRNEYLNRLIAQVGKHTYQKMDNSFVMELCLNAAIGLGAREAIKLEDWGNSVEHQLSITLDRVTSLIEGLKSGSVFGKTKGVDYELIRAYLKLDEEGLSDV